jgi:hypothetical protein
MSSGMKNLVINTQERAISPDINRLQTFKAFDVAEMFRYLIDVSDTDAAPGAITEYTSVGTPLRAEVFNGLMVAPQAGSINLYITPGALYAIAPDGGAEDSVYKFVKSAGIQTNGVLTIAANASGSPRIDVVECQWTTATVESDSRDIFDETTGLFVAAVVPKVTQGALNYRVRQGTPGSGYPAPVSGWLPLAVALVPNGSTNNDAVTFWDVRPLLTDRPQIQNRSRLMPDYIEQLAFLNVADFAGEARLSGRCEVQYRNRAFGGTFTSGTTEGTTTQEYIDLRNVINQSSGFAFPAASMVYGYWTQPFGLPRWVKYTSSPAVRAPGHARGIFVLSTLAPNSRGQASAAIAMPVASGFIGQSCEVENAILAMAFRTSGSLPVAGVQTIREYETTTPAVAATLVSGASGDDFANYTFIPGTHFPANAKAVYVRFVINIPMAASQATGVDGTFEVLTPSGVGVLCREYVTGGSMATVYNNAAFTQTINYQVSKIRIPVPSNFPSLATPPSFIVRWVYDIAALALSSALTVGSSSFQITGWEL